MTSPKMREKYREERKELGLQGHNPAAELFEDAWAKSETRADLLMLQDEEWSKLREKNERFNRHWGPVLEKFREKDFNIEEQRKQHVLLEQRPDEFDGFDDLPSVRAELAKAKLGRTRRRQSEAPLEQ